MPPSLSATFVRVATIRRAALPHPGPASALLRIAVMAASLSVPLVRPLWCLPVCRFAASAVPAGSPLSSIVRCTLPPEFTSPALVHLCLCQWLPLSFSPPSWSGVLKGLLHGATSWANLLGVNLIGC